MRFLLIGGSGFIGSPLAALLAAQGHETAVFHRGTSGRGRLGEFHSIQGDRANLAGARNQFRDFHPDVVIDLILSSESQARATLDAFRGLCGRIVAVSSGDVYRAAGVLHGTETGPLQQMPLTEDSELRSRPQYSSEVLQGLKQALPWLDNDYDKIPVERAILSDPDIAGTVLRLPMVYGPGDPLHRLYPYLKRMDDGRPAILLPEDVARWRGPRSYVENVAAGIAFAAVSEQAAGRIYNIAEEPAFTEQEWVRRVGDAAGWRGSIIGTPPELTPAHMKVPYNTAQHWVMSSSRIREELGYVEPVGLDVALERTIAWERGNPPAHMDPSQFDYAAEDAALTAL